MQQRALIEPRVPVLYVHHPGYSSRYDYMSSCKFFDSVPRNGNTNSKNMRNTRSSGSTGNKHSYITVCHILPAHSPSPTLSRVYSNLLFISLASTCHAYIARLWALCNMHTSSITLGKLANADGELYKYKLRDVCVRWDVCLLKTFIGRARWQVRLCGLLEVVKTLVA